MSGFSLFLIYDLRYTYSPKVLGAAARSNCQGRKSELEKAAKLEGASLPSSPTSKQGKTNSRIENSFREIAGKTVRKLPKLYCIILGNITLLRLFWLGHLLHSALPSSVQPSQVLYRIPRGKSRRGKRWRHPHLSTYCKCNTTLPSCIDGGSSVHCAAVLASLFYPPARTSSYSIAACSTWEKGKVTQAGGGKGRSPFFGGKTHVVLSGFPRVKVREKEQRSKDESLSPPSLFSTSRICQKRGGETGKSFSLKGGCEILQ